MTDTDDVMSRHLGAKSNDENTVRRLLADLDSCMKKKSSGGKLKAECSQALQKFVGPYFRINDSTTFIFVKLAINKGKLQQI